MDLRTRTTLLCGVLALAIAASIVLRRRVRSVHLVFAGFAADMGLWYLAQALYGFSQASIWSRVTAMLAIALPLFALHLFEKIVPHASGARSRLLPVATVLAVAMAVLVLSPVHRAGIARFAVLLYVFGLLAAGFVSLALRGRRSPSRATQSRVRFLVVIGAVASTASLADFLWFIGAELPPVGAVLAIVFLFLLAESFRRERLLDLYEMVGRLMVSTALAFALAGIFYVFVTYVGRFNTMYLNAVLAAIVILLLFEPLRARVERQIHAVFFRERFALASAVADARRQLVHALDVSEIGPILVATLEPSRRATAAGWFVSTPTGDAYDWAGGFGAEVPPRIERAMSRALLDQLARGPVVLEEVAQAATERRAAGESHEAEEAVLAAASMLGGLRSGVCLGARTQDGELAGVLVVADDRVHDAFAPEEVAELDGLASQLAVVLENSHVWRRMQEKDRLAAIGQMAAGLAHEVKNPLGAIKGAAQLLAEPGPDGAANEAATREFLGIILEEVERLDRVVGSVLDYARPRRESPAPVDVNAVVRRTLQILASDSADEGRIDLELGDALPRVRIDAEQLRQVIMNLVRNAMQAMAGRGAVRVTTRARAGGRGRSDLGAEGAAWIELSVADSGPGMSQKVLKNLFVPFFSTKDHGTGLGLAISQRIIDGAGGTIEVLSHEGAGTTFTVVLPAAPPGAHTPPTPPVTAGDRERA